MSRESHGKLCQIGVKVNRIRGSGDNGMLYRSLPEEQHSHEMILLEVLPNWMMAHLDTGPEVAGDGDVVEACPLPTKRAHATLSHARGSAFELINLT